MTNNGLTNIFGFILASDMMKNAIQKIAAQGFTPDAIGDVVGAVAAALWAYFTNKPAI